MTDAPKPGSRSDDAPLSEDQIATLIDNSGGHWREDHFVIDGRELSDMLQAAAAVSERGALQLEPTPAMIEAGAQRLVRWETGKEKWPDAWSKMDVRAARNDAERCWRSMWLEATASYFWCEKHKQAHRKGDDQRECLLVGPYRTKEQADEFGAARPAERDSI